MVVGEVVAKFKLDLRNFNAGINTAQKNLSTATEGMRRRFSSLRGAIFSLQGALAGLGIGMIGKSFIQAASSMEVFSVQLETSLGSLDRAKDLLQWIRVFAAKTPFEIKELVQASTLLQAVGMDAKNTIETIGNAAASFGRNIMDVTQALISMESEPLRRLGIQVRRTGDEAVFQWSDAMGRMQERTAKGGYDIQRQVLLTIWNERYKGGMERFSKTWEGKFSNLKDAIFNWSAAVGRAILPALKELVDTLIPVVEGWENWAKANEEIIKQKIQETVNSIVNTVEKIYTIYKALPKEAFEFGLVGYMILGKKGAALGLLLAYTSDEIGKLQKRLDDLKMSWGEALLYGTPRPTSPEDLGKFTIGSLPGEEPSVPPTPQPVVAIPKAIDPGILTKEQQKLWEKLSEEMIKLRESDLLNLRQWLQDSLESAGGNAELQTEVWNVFYAKKNALRLKDLEKEKEVTNSFLELSAGAFDDYEQMLSAPMDVLEAQAKEINEKITGPLRAATTQYFDSFAEAYDDFEAMMTATPDRIAAAIEEANKATEAWKEKYTQSWFDFKEMSEEFSRETARAMQRNFSELFFDFLTGELKTFEDYWKSFTKSLARMFADVISQMISRWLLMKAMMAAGSWGTGGGGGGMSGWGLQHQGSVPKLHGGLRADEYPAIIQRGEALIKRSAVNQRTAGTLNYINQTGNVPSEKGGDVSIYISAVDAKSVYELLYRNRRALNDLTALGIRQGGNLRATVRNT